MARYPFITGVREFLEKDGDYYKEVTRNSLDRKLRFFGKIFEALKKEGKAGSTNPRTITAEDIHAFVGNRIKNRIKNNVILHDLSTLKTFLLSFGNNAVDEYKIKYRARVPRSVHNMREPLDENVVRRILERALAVGPGTWKLFEGYALVSIALCTGLRPLELRQCLVSNIREDELGFIIHAKHVKGEDTWGKPRDVPVMWQGGEILRRYLAARAEKLKHLDRRSNALFPPLRGNEEFLSSNSLLVMKNLVEEDIGVRFELRTCRCTFGQLGLDEGHPLVNVSKALGHTSAVTTQKYYADKRQSVVVNEMRVNSGKKLGEGVN